MEYTKIKIELSDHPKELNRTILVKGNPDLRSLGIIFEMSVNAAFEHLFQFRNKECLFVEPSLIEGYSRLKEISLDEAHLSDLTDKFDYTYDMGEGWDFKCKVYAKKTNIAVEDDDYPIAYVTDGKGAGIIEDDHELFDRIMNGEVDLSISETDEENEIYFPYNMFLTKLGDIYEFDNLYEDGIYEDELEDFFEHTRLNDDIPDVLDTDEMIRNVKEDAAVLIFHDEKINKCYRRLIINHDINEAYEMVVDTILECIKETDDIPMTGADFGDLLYEKLEDLE